MKRNLNRRVETIVPVDDRTLQRQLDEIIAVYEKDNNSAWDCGPDGTYVRRAPQGRKKKSSAQETFIRLA